MFISSAGVVKSFSRKKRDNLSVTINSNLGFLLQVTFTICFSFAWGVQFLLNVSKGPREAPLLQ
jgi:hypothetical protein